MSWRSLAVIFFALCVIGAFTVSTKIMAASPASATQGASARPNVGNNADQTIKAPGASKLPKAKGSRLDKAGSWVAINPQPLPPKEPPTNAAGTQPVAARAQ